MATSLLIPSTMGSAVVTGAVCAATAEVDGASAGVDEAIGVV